MPGQSWAELAPEHPLFRHAGTTAARVVYDVPLSVNGASLADTAAGDHDVHWSQLGQAVKQSPKTSIIRLRLPDQPDGQEAKDAFRRAAQSVRSTNPQARLEWAAPVGSDPRQAPRIWPGADVVDVVGLSIPASGSWTDVLAGDGGLIDWADWAHRSGKKVALHWQLGPDTDPAWVHNVNSWIQVLVAQRRMAYESVSHAGTPNPTAMSTYQALWSEE